LAFHIRKTAEGRALWLKRLTPAIVWGPKVQARIFATKGDARLTLALIPKADRAAIVDDETPESGN
jgi:hypothetical protein